MFRIARIFLAAVALAGARAAVAQDALNEPRLAANPLTVPDGKSQVTLSPDLRPQFWFGVAVENVPAAFSRQLKLLPNQGLFVTMVMPGSPAEKSGLRAEDLLIAINGEPLTSQADLARAANAPRELQVGAGKLATPLMKPSTIRFLRDGNPGEIEITPGIRPVNTLVIGPNIGDVTPALNVAPANRAAPQSQTIVPPHGRPMQVGPGFRVDLQGAGSEVRMIREAVGTGQSVIYTRQTDESGNATITLRRGQETYTLDPTNLDSLPPSLRPLAEQLMAANIPSDAASARGGAAVQTLDQRLEVLERHNEELMQQIERDRQSREKLESRLEELTRLLEEKLKGN